MTKLSGSGTGFTFLEEPKFEKRDGKITCQIRVRYDGVESVIELELDGDEWRVVSSDVPLPPDSTDVVDVVRGEFRRSTIPPMKH